MTTLIPQDGDIPAPEASLVSRPFWDAVARHRLAFQRCTRCSTAVHVPSPFCSSCWSDELVWEEGSGKGTVHSWTVVWRPQTPAFHVPYAPAIVDMQEGWQLLTSIVGCDPAEIRPGMPVAIEFHETARGIVLPYVRPTAGPA